MKRIVLAALAILIFYHPSDAQITSPVIRANFGVDADLRANYFNSLITAGNDDWFNNGTAGLGQFVIDTAGAASILARYASNPASRMSSFSRLMRQAPYSVVSNRLLLDAIFTRDYHGDDSTVFASGSNKNGMSPISWSCPVSQGIPDKNDILDAFTHARRAGPNITDSLWMFGGISIENTTGNRYFDFELYQTDFYYDRSTRTFQNYGPEAGHTAWLFNADGSVKRPGDIIFTAEYSSSSLTLLEARIWVHQSSLSMTPMYFNWGGLFDGAGSGAVYGYASILPKTAGTFYAGLQCGNGVWPGPFNVVRQDNTVATFYNARQFMEFSVNMTKLGLDPAYISTNGCSTPFRRVLVKTRASTSFTAELKDFVAPFRMFDYPLPQAVAELPIFCGSMGVSDISVINPISTSTYTWTTTDGHILGSNTGPTIVVDTTGTYIVAQKMHVQCPVYAYDTASIAFDSFCEILEKNLTDFSGVLREQNAILNWRVTQNEQISNFYVEYSTDNSSFIELADVGPTHEYGQENYKMQHDLKNISSAMLYYRLRIKGRTGKIVYSNVVAIRLNKEMKQGLLIFPNPSSDQAWASFTSQKNGETEYAITDMNNKLISRKKIQILNGHNTISLSELDNAMPGVYIIKIAVDGVSYIRKILISR